VNERLVKTDQRAFAWCGDLNDSPTINLGLTVRQYFAAHAPEVPADYEWKEVPRLTSGSNGIGTTVRRMRESATERMVRWRKHYADLMVSTMGGGT
jgi:hypothetical protein